MILFKIAAPHPDHTSKSSASNCPFQQSPDLIPDHTSLSLLSSSLTPITSFHSHGQTKLLLGSFTLPVTLRFSLPCPLASPTPLSVPLAPLLPCLSLTPNSSAWRLHVPAAAAAWPPPPPAAPISPGSLQPIQKDAYHLVNIQPQEDLRRPPLPYRLPTWHRGVRDTVSPILWSQGWFCSGNLRPCTAPALFLRGPHFQKQSFGLFTTWDRVQAFLAEMLGRNQFMPVHEFPHHWFFSICSEKE